MTTYYTDEHGIRYEVRRGEDGEAYLEPAESEMPQSAPAPLFEKPAQTWAEVYRVSSCNNCNRADCPSCAQKFLDFLQSSGKRPSTP